MRKSSLQGTAEKLGIPYVTVSLHRGAEKNSWISPKSGQPVCVEAAVLDRFSLDGWRGYSGEGGLLLNLIKAMSFEKISPRNRSTYIEALYAQNVVFEDDKFSPEALLGRVAVADKITVEKNFDLMTSREKFTIQYDGFSSASSTSMLDFFPSLNRWMFVELLDVAGNKLMHSIASKFIESPYEYRRGWPDITMWKNNKLEFVEVKAPGDRLQDSQKKIFSNFAKPLGLNFTLVDVCDADA